MAVSPTVAAPPAVDGTGASMASGTVAKISNRDWRPVRRRSLDTRGAGAARRSTPPSRPARRLTPTSTASALASQKVTPDRSTMIRPA
jgi:hypothetical protein